MESISKQLMDFIQSYATDPQIMTLIANAARYIDKLEIEVNSKQAEIDRLMFEYCPDAMTEEQKAEWAEHQIFASKDEIDVINKALEKSTEVLSKGDLKDE